MTTAKRDPNRVPTLIGVSTADGATPVNVKVDATTQRLYVDVAAGTFVGATQVTDNEAVDVADTGVLILGTDGSNYQIAAVDSSGNLQVDVLTGGGGTQYAVDAALGATPTGTLAVAKRDDALSALTPVEGDAVELRVDANGALWVGVSGSVAVTGTFWQATQPISAASLPLPTGASTEATLLTIDADTGNIVTSVQLLDNLVLLEDVAHTTGDPGIQMLAVRDDTLNARSGAENDYEPLHTDANGALWTVLVAETTKVIGTVNIAASQTIAVTNAGTFVTQENGAALTALQLIDNVVGVEDAGETAGGGLAMAGSVRRDTPASSAGTTGDNATVNTDNLGRLYTHPSPSELDLATLSTNHVKKYYTSAGAVTDGIIWSPAAGKRWFITDIFINVSAAATVTLEDDLAAGDSAVWKAELAANSGWSHSFSTPLFSGEDAADLIVTTSTGNIYILCVGYEI